MQHQVPFTSSDSDVAATWLLNQFHAFFSVLLHLAEMTSLRLLRRFAVAGCQWNLRVYSHCAKTKSFEFPSKPSENDVAFGFAVAQCK